MNFSDTFVPITFLFSVSKEPEIIFMIGLRVEN